MRGTGRAAIFYLTGFLSRDTFNIHMRGTSIFSLPSLLIGAALGNNREQTKNRSHETTWDRVRFEWHAWRAVRHGEQALQDSRDGTCTTIHQEHFESFDRFKELMR